MKFRHQLLWILCAALIWAGFMHWHKSDAQAAVPSEPLSPAGAALLAEGSNQENRGRYQLVIHADGLLIFDTATAESWIRIPPDTRWTRIDAPLDIQQRGPWQTLTNASKDPLNLFPRK